MMKATRTESDASSWSGCELFGSMIPGGARKEREGWKLYDNRHASSHVFRSGHSTSCNSGAQQHEQEDAQRAAIRLFSPKIARETGQGLCQGIEHRCCEGKAGHRPVRGRTAAEYRCMDLAPQAGLKWRNESPTLTPKIRRNWGEAGTAA